MFVKKNGQWVDEGGEVTADKLQEVIENNQEQLGSVIQEAVSNSTGISISSSIPELTEERIVATLNGKPVYEIFYSDVLPSASNNWVILKKIGDNVSPISFSGALEKDNNVHAVCIPYNTSNLAIMTAFDKNGNLVIYNSHSSCNGKKFVLRVQYIKLDD